MDLANQSALSYTAFSIWASTSVFVVRTEKSSKFASANLHAV